MTSLTSKLVTGDGRAIAVKEAAELYRSCVNHSIPSRGQIQRLSEGAYSIKSYFKTTDCDTRDAIETFKIYSLATRSIGAEVSCIDSVRCVSEANQVGDVASTTSKNGRYQARVRNSGSDKQVLELWDRSRLLKTIELSSLETNDGTKFSFVANILFSSFLWSPFGDQDKLLLVCQRKHSKPLSFFSTEEGVRGEEYIRQQDWGEGLTGVEHTSIVVLDLADECKVTMIDVDGCSLGNSQWLADNKIVSVAYNEEPSRLGLKFCNNRPSSIVIHDLELASQSAKLFQELKSEQECFYSPKVSHSGNKFVYLGGPIFGSHQHTSRLYLYDLSNNTNQYLVDKSNFKDRFFSNCIEGSPLVNNPFTTDDKNIIFTERDHLYKHMFIYNIEQGYSREIKFPTTGLSLLDFQYNIILASGSEVNTTPTLYTASLNPSNLDDVVAWHQLEDCIHLQEINYETFEIRAPNSNDNVSAIMIKPCLRSLQAEKSESGLITDEDKLPTMILPHGGPNSNFTVEYLGPAVFYARAGLKTLLINYRGSTGVSEKYMEDLCGKLGLDVDDCLHIIRHLVGLKKLDPEKLVLYGGSHGGFLCAHLSCRTEFKFSSATLRNPVIDISTMVPATDIPDWCVSQAIGNAAYNQSWKQNKEELIKMFECSPAARVSEAKTPTLILLGSKDRRVPMNQGEYWYTALKAHGVETLCKIYPDDHSLMKPIAAADVHLTSLIWILDHLPKL